VLGRLKTINPALVARLSSRLFFAVNKMDQADEGCGLDDEETQEYVAGMVTSQLNCPDFKLHPDQVSHHPVSALRYHTERMLFLSGQHVREYQCCHPALPAYLFVIAEIFLQ
jgi:hypothetical protein